MPAGRPPVVDQFTALDIPRQRKWQLRRLARNLCSGCGQEPLFTKTMGKLCHAKLKVENRAKQRDQQAGAKFVRGKVRAKKALTNRILKLRKASN